MKKLFIPIIALLGFSACQDCKDCTANTDVTVLVETFNPNTATSTSYNYLQSYRSVQVYVYNVVAESPIVTVLVTLLPSYSVNSDPQNSP